LQRVARKAASHPNIAIIDARRVTAASKPAASRARLTDPPGRVQGPRRNAAVGLRYIHHGTPTVVVPSAIRSGMSPCITDGAPPNHLTKPLALLDDRHKGMLTAPTLHDPHAWAPDRRRRMMVANSSHRRTRTSGHHGVRRVTGSKVCPKASLTRTRIGRAQNRGLATEAEPRCFERPLRHLR
jgi:hypothetical protein